MERAARHSTALFNLNLVSTRAQRAGLFQLMVAAMMIPVVIIWMVLPCFNEVRVVILGDRNQPHDVSYGEVMGLRLAYPSVLLLYYFLLLHFSIGMVNATEKCEPGGYKEQLYTVVECLSIQQAFGNWEKLNFLGCFAYAAVPSNHFLESEAFICLWVGWALWAYVRFQVNDRIQDLVIELEKITSEE